jgi:hypothetical protein
VAGASPPKIPRAVRRRMIEPSSPTKQSISLEGGRRFRYNGIRRFREEPLDARRLSQSSSMRGLPEATCLAPRRSIPRSTTAPGCLCRPACPRPRSPCRLAPARPREFHVEGVSPCDVVLPR